jgi:hypothetical protein
MTNKNVNAFRRRMRTRSGWNAERPSSMFVVTLSYKTHAESFAMHGESARAVRKAMQREHPSARVRVRPE